MEQIEKMEKKEEKTTLVEKASYPKSVVFIIGNEFCERFSFYGYRAILVMYLMDYLGLSKSTSAGLFHLLIVFCYTMPIFGAILADGYLDKYRTIKYLSFIYVIGEIIMLLFAFSPPHWVGPVIGLFLIAVGTGGIKPCVAAFGGDQFEEDQKQERDTFFSMFYLAINLGSLVAMVVIPFAKDEVSCFGHKCYCLAFSIPAILMIMSLTLFVWGKKYYKITPATGSVITNFFKCIASALYNRLKGSETKEHWLDYAGEEFPNQQLQDFKQVFKILVLFLPFPVFWALYDQMGSLWTLQAIQLDRKITDNFYLLAEQFQALNSLLIFIVIPLLEFCIYPCLNKLHIPNRLLQRLAIGMTLAGISFVCAAILQVSVNKSNSPTLEETNSHLIFINHSPCNVTIQGSLPLLELPAYKITIGNSVPSDLYQFDISVNNHNVTKDHEYQLLKTKLDNGRFLELSKSGKRKVKTKILKVKSEEMKKNDTCGDTCKPEKDMKNEISNKTNPVNLETNTNHTKNKTENDVTQSKMASEDMTDSRWIISHKEIIFIGNASNAACTPENIKVTFQVALQRLFCYYVVINMGNKNNIKKWKSVNRELLPVNDTLEETEKPELLVKKVFNASNVFVVKNIEEEEEEEENYLVVNVYSYDLEKEPTGGCYVRALLVGTAPDDIDNALFVNVFNHKTVSFDLTPYRMPSYQPISPGVYFLRVKRQKVSTYEFTNLEFKNGGKYTVLINKESENVLNTITLVDLLPNQVSIWCQLPQYIVITLGEALFSVSGLLFAYSQAPPSMKSVVQAFWLLCTAVGNLFDFFITTLQLIPDPTWEFLFFAFTSFIVTILFAIMANFYQYVEQQDQATLSEPSTNINKSNYDSILGSSVASTILSDATDKTISEDKRAIMEEESVERKPSGVKGYVRSLQNYVSNINR